MESSLKEIVKENRLDLYDMESKVFLGFGSFANVMLVKRKSDGL
jgi:hypothetical protein